MSTTIRVSERTRDRLAALSKATDRPMTAIVDDALDELERRQFFATCNDRWAELRQDPDAWDDIVAERGVEEGALGDGDP